MSIWRLARFTRVLHRAQRIDADRLRDLRARKLRRAVAEAYRHVPFYRERFDEAGLLPDDIRTLGDLPKIPVTTRDSLQAAGTDALTSTRYRGETLARRQTSGSSGRPLTVQLDPATVDRRRALFLRVLFTAGYRPGRKMLLLGGPETAGVSARWTRMDRMPFDTPPDLVADRITRFRPCVLYGWLTPLRRLAGHLRETGTVLPGIRSVVTTAETLDPVSRVELETFLGAEVYDTYGLTETGMIAWECRAHDGYHVAEDAAALEYGEPVGTDGSRKVLVTTLDVSATPMLRVDTGDLAIPEPEQTCSCGRTFGRVRRLGGRAVDCIRLDGGGLVSPYSVTLALENVSGIRRYQVVQDGPDRVLVRFQEDGGPRPETAGAARGAVREALGGNVRVEAVRVDSLDPEPGRKFRVVESRIRG